MSAAETNTCLACRRTGEPQLFEPGPPAIVRCPGCGFMWTVPEHSRDEQAGFFAADYIADEERAEHDFGSMRRATLAREAAALRGLRPAGGRLLDVGCASGEFLLHMRGHAGWQVQGIDPSSFAVRHARERHGLDVREGTLESVRFPAGSFDVVSVLDVIGFWRDPDADFAAIAGMLAPGGLLAIEIPCLRFRLLKNSGPVCRLVYGKRTQLNQRLHLHFWSRRTLGMQLARHGFREVGAFAEQSPLYGALPFRAMNHAYFAATRALYAATGGRVPLVPKEFLVYGRGA